MVTNIPVVDEIIQNNFGVDLEREIGRGKYGVVYAGINRSDRRSCAIKVISLPTPEMEEKLRDVYGDNIDAMTNIVREMAGKFQNEIKSMQMLGSMNAQGSRNIVRMNNHILIQDGMYFHVIISMELVMPLKRYLAQENLTVDKVIDIGYQAARGLQLCHSEGIIHRDVKEDNLFLDSGGQVKIGDFGVANMSDGVVSNRTEGVGTPHYMAPEVKNNVGYNHSVDIYSLGIVMYMLLNENRPAFSSMQIDEHTAYKMRMGGQPLPPPRHAPEMLSQIILKCCQYYPEHRYRNMAELMEDLEYAKSHLAPEERVRTVPYPKRSYSDADWWNNKFSRDYTKTMYSTEAAVNAAPKRNVLRDTIGAFMDILQKFGKGSAEGRMVEEVYTKKGAAERDMKEAERRVRFMRRILIALLCVVIILAAAAVLLYPKTATFYANSADGQKLYVKYMFFPEKKLSDLPASYISADGNYIYFSRPDLEHPEGQKVNDQMLYRVNMWTGQETLLYDGECEYDVIIGDYIYFANWKDHKNLYRIKKDGSGVQCVLDNPVGDLKNINGSLEFLTPKDGNENWFDEPDYDVKMSHLEKKIVDVSSF